MLQQNFQIDLFLRAETPESICMEHIIVRIEKSGNARVKFTQPVFFGVVQENVKATREEKLFVTRFVLLDHISFMADFCKHLQTCKYVFLPDTCPVGWLQLIEPIKTMCNKMLAIGSFSNMCRWNILQSLRTLFMSSLCISGVSASMHSLSMALVQFPGM